MVFMANENEINSKDSNKYRRYLKKAAEKGYEIIRTIIFVILLLLTPVLFYRTETEIKVDPGAFLRVLAELGDSESSPLTYMAGKSKQSIKNVLPPKIKITFSFVFGAGAACIIYALVLGLLIPADKRWFRECVGFIGIIPDFILVLMLQFGAVAFTQTLHFRVLRIAWISTDKPVVALPIIVLTLIAGTYLAGSVSIEKRAIEKKDYIKFARARGIGELRLHLRHIMPGIIRSIQSDLLILLSIITSSMFIIERMLNIPGLTRFMFSYVFITDYSYFIYNDPLEIQIILGVTVLLALIGIFLLSYYLLYLLLALLTKVIDP
jgi:peptide/nickel transport system permease protein